MLETEARENELETSLGYTVGQQDGSAGKDICCASLVS